MTAKQRAKRRDLVTVQMMDGPYLYALGRMPANAAIKFKANPWQVFEPCDRTKEA